MTEEKGIGGIRCAYECCLDVVARGEYYNGRRISAPRTNEAVAAECLRPVCADDASQVR